MKRFVYVGSKDEVLKTYRMLSVLEEKENLL